MKEARGIYGTEQIDVSDLVEGMYFIRLENKQVFETLKFIKM